MRQVRSPDHERQPSVHSVGRLAGVSASTVSAVFTGRVGVRPSTRAAVLAAAERLHYHPNPAARSLRTGHTNTIAFAVRDIAGATIPAVIRSALMTATDRGYELSLFDLADDPEREVQFQRRLLQSPVSGAIIHSFRGEVGRYEAAIHRGVALTFMDQRPTLEGVDFVSTESRMGARLVVRHCAQGGRRRIGIIVGPQDQTIFRDRLSGYREAVIDEGLILDDRLIKIAPSSIDGASESVAELIAQGDLPDAIYAASSLLSIGAFRALRRRGLRMPADIAFVGTGSIEWADLIEPPLTMLGIPAAEIGRRAVELVLDRIERPGQSGRSVLIQPTLVVRRSSGGEPE